MTDLQPHSLVAFNTATASANKIHDDVVAKRLGFRGGLVPGVDVYAYLCHPPAAAWGLDWLRHGTMRARFHRPVYDGHRVEVSPDGGGRLTLRDEGERCAEGEAAVAPPAALPTPGDWPVVPQATNGRRRHRPRWHPAPPSASSRTPSEADKAGEYLADIREPLSLFADERIAHPGWILRDANYVLSANVQLGPWIHVESIAQHHDVVHDGEVVSARAVVTNEWERKGHRFVELDVLHLADDRPVARTIHTAIYHPRGV